MISQAPLLQSTLAPMLPCSQAPLLPSTHAPQLKNEWVERQFEPAGSRSNYDKWSS
jgi:hypothetical protein